MGKTLAFALTTLVSAFSATQLYAQSLDGLWHTIDDKTGSSKAILKIQKEANGTYSAKIMELTPPPGYTPKKICTTCPTPYTNQPILGMKILVGLKENTGNENTAYNYVDGRILDPMSGNLYTVKAKLNMGGEHLIIRGYTNNNALPRSQTWIRSN